MILAGLMSMCHSDSMTLEAFGGKKAGETSSGVRDFFFVAKREGGRCALVVGREYRDDWQDRPEDQPPESIRLLARAEQSFLSRVSDGPAERLERFRKGFVEVVERTQSDLQANATERLGQTPALTLTLAYIDGLRLYVGHVGNDRCYLLRGDTLHRITTDQSQAPPPPDRPLVSDPMLSKKPTSLVGGFSEDLVTEISAMDLQRGDIVFLCTAGVTNVVPDQSIAEILRVASMDRATSLEVFADSIFRAVAEHQGKSDSAMAIARLAA
jgi:serine/threonine protein phosphatase PrpC